MNNYPVKDQGGCAAHSHIWCHSRVPECIIREVRLLCCHVNTQSPNLPTTHCWFCSTWEIKRFIYMIITCSSEQNSVRDTNGAQHCFMSRRGLVIYPITGAKQQHTATLVTCDVRRGGSGCGLQTCSAGIHASLARPFGEPSKLGAAADQGLVRLRGRLRGT